MLDSSLSYIIIRSFPECILLILTSYILIGIELDFKDIFKYATLYLIVLTFIRKLPISFGIHTFLSMFALGIILYKLKKQDVIQTILAVAKIFICLAISEGIYMFIISDIVGVPMDLLTNNTKVISALLTLPSLFIFIMLIRGIKLITKKLSKNY